MIPFAVTPPPDPNSVVAGWIPLVLTLALGAVMYFLYRSLRKQMRKIDIPEEGIPTRAEDRRAAQTSEAVREDETLR
ncbi:MAG: hypothetical protein Q4G46_11860 [Propionibacteriaceae bacterium]|nr:hypothetical protein [Propionibacteriaceae bacterium]